MHCLDDPWKDDQRHVKRNAMAENTKLLETMFLINPNSYAGGRHGIADFTRQPRNTEGSHTPPYTIRPRS